jgi:hypothetical protein
MPDRGDCRNRRARRLQRLLASDDFIPAHNGAPPGMRMFGDDDKIADLGIAIDPAQNLRLPFDSRIAPDHGVRAVHLGYILNPRFAFMRQSQFVFNVSPEIAAPDIAEIPERPDSIHHPIAIEVAEQINPLPNSPQLLPSSRVTKPITRRG